MGKRILCKFNILKVKSKMIGFSRFVKKKTDDGNFIIVSKLKTGKKYQKPSGKQWRQICDALNESVVKCLEPKPAES